MREPVHDDSSELITARLSQVQRAVLELRLRPLGLTAPRYVALRLVERSPGLTV